MMHQQLTEAKSKHSPKCRRQNFGHKARITRTTLTLDLTETHNRLMEQFLPHKVRVVNETVEANICKALLGKTNIDTLLFEEKLSMNFIFTRKSSIKYKKQN